MSFESVHIISLAIALLLIVALVVLVLFFVTNYRKSVKKEKESSNSTVSLPIRLRAYERLSLLLNRLEPKNLLVGMQETTNTTLELKDRLIAKIRDEYNHNVSQQIYVSEVLWEELQDVQHNLIELVNSAYLRCKESNNVGLFAKLILEAYYSQEQTFIDSTMILLKSEVKDLF